MKLTKISKLCCFLSDFKWFSKPFKKYIYLSILKWEILKLLKRLCPLTNLPDILPQRTNVKDFVKIDPCVRSLHTAVTPRSHTPSLIHKTNVSSLSLSNKKRILLASLGHPIRDMESYFSGIPYMRRERSGGPLFTPLNSYFKTAVFT